MSRHERPTSRSSRSASPLGPQGRSDGKVDISCPQCGAKYRIVEDLLESKIECRDCHRVFFAKTTVGKRVKARDHTQTYWLFGIGAGLVILTFVLISRGGDKPAPKPKEEAAARPTYTLQNHPRALQLVRWAEAMGNDNRLGIPTYNDMGALASKLRVTPGDANAVFAAVQTHASTVYLREMVCDAASLANEAAKTAPTGKGKVYVSPRAGTDDYLPMTRGEIEVEFRAQDDQIKVTDWIVTMVPARNPKKPAASPSAPAKPVAKPAPVPAPDPASAQPAKEAKPTAVPHWSKATPEQRQEADQTVADVLRSAYPQAPADLLQKATASVQTSAQRQAVVPRLLNAMYELSSDVTTHNGKLGQLNRALCSITGFTVDYDLAGTGDAKQDQARREASIRQWFGLWRRYCAGELDAFVEGRDQKPK